MSPIDLPKLRQVHPELRDVWDSLAGIEDVLRRKPFLDVRLLKSTGIHATRLTAAVLAMADLGDFRYALKVEDPYDRTLQAEEYDCFEDIPENLVDELDRQFRRADAVIVPVLIETHGR